MTTVHCPNCNKALEWGPQSPYRPFCSQRCRTMDLGGWLDGSNSIPGAELAEDQLIHLQLDSPPANDDPA